MDQQLQNLMNLDPDQLENYQQFLQQYLEQFGGMGDENNEHFIEEINQHMQIAEDLQNLEEPDWQKNHLTWLSSSYLKQRIHDIILQLPKSSQCFYLGIIYEFGFVSKHEQYQIDYEKAFDFYQQGTELNNSFCYFRMFFIYKQNPKKFSKFLLQNYKQNQFEELSLFYLVKAAAYSDYYIDTRYKQYPFYRIAIESDTDDNFLNRIHDSIDIYGEDDTQFLHAFLNYWLTINNDKFRQKSLKQWVEIARKGHVQASYWLAEMIRNGEDFLNVSIGKAIYYYDYCIQNGMYQAYTGKGLLYQENLKNIEKANKCFIEGAKYYCFVSLNESSCYIFRNKIQNQYEKGLQNLVDSFTLGYTFAADDLEFVVSKMKIQFENLEKYKQTTYEAAYSFNQNNDFQRFEFTNYGPQIYILADMYEKGIYVKKDLKKALEIIKDNSAKIQNNKKYLLFKLAKLYQKLNMKEEASDQFKLAFDEYENASQKIFYHSASLFYRQFS